MTKFSNGFKTKFIAVKITHSTAIDMPRQFKSEVLSSNVTTQNENVDIRYIVKANTSRKRRYIEIPSQNRISVTPKSISIFEIPCTFSEAVRQHCPHHLLCGRESFLFAPPVSQDIHKESLFEEDEPLPHQVDHKQRQRGKNDNHDNRSDLERLVALVFSVWTCR